MRLIKYIFKACAIVSIILSASSCAKDIVQHNEPLHLNGNLEQITLSRDTERKILLHGGNGKYKALVESTQIAQVRTNLDTLKVKGVWEGETFVLIASHDQTLRVPIKVVYPELNFSAGSIQLYPKQRSKFVSLVGGDEYSTLTKEDDNDVIDYRWDATTNLVEINAHREGTAKLIARTKEGKEIVLNVIVKTEDEPKEYGIYGTDGRFLSNNVSIAPLMFVHRPGVGTWFSNVATPLGALRGADNGQLYYDGAVIKVQEINNPKVGDEISFSIEAVTAARAATPYGQITAKVVEIKPDGVILLSKHHKFYLPYNKSTP